MKGALCLAGACRLKPKITTADWLQVQYFPPSQLLKLYRASEHTQMDSDCDCHLPSQCNLAQYTKQGKREGKQVLNRGAPWNIESAIRHTNCV